MLAVHPPTNGKGLWDIQHSISRTLDARFHTWFIMTLYYKTRQILLQSATAILLQNTDVYCKMRQVFYYAKCDDYYKLRQYNEKRGRLKFGWIHSFDSLHNWVITDSVCSAVGSMISWWVNFFLSLFFTFRTNVRMSIIPYPCSFLFAVHLEWPLI